MDIKQSGTFGVTVVENRTSHPSAHAQPLRSPDNPVGIMCPELQREKINKGEGQIHRHDLFIVHEEEI